MSASETAVSPQTLRDNENAKYFHDGWKSALKELTLIAEYRGAHDAVTWAQEQINHPKGTK